MLIVFCVFDVFLTSLWPVNLDRSVVFSAFLRNPFLFWLFHIALVVSIPEVLDLDA